MTGAAVYRLYDADNDLLYIGSSKELPQRYKDHARSKPWWPDVRRRTETWYETRQQAYGAERKAINTERPRYNVNDQVPELTPLELEMIALGDQFKRDREALADLRKRCQAAAVEGRAAGLSTEKISWHLGIEKNTAQCWIYEGTKTATGAPPVRRLRA